jgi:hypothetical protein
MQMVGNSAGDAGSFYQFENKEKVVYSLLNRIQQFILAHDPNISKLADESFYNFIKIIIGFVTKEKKVTGSINI